MIDINVLHPFSACAEFVVQFVSYLADYNLAAIEDLIDENKTGMPLEECFPRPEDYKYMQLLDASEWSFHVLCNSPSGFLLDIEVPLTHERIPYTFVRFKMVREKQSLIAYLWETLPHRPLEKLNLDNIHVSLNPIKRPTREE